MPYIAGRGSIQDVYHSGNVYVNNVAVATWLSPNTSAAFAADISVPAVDIADISTTATTQAASLVSVPMAAAAVSQNAIEAEYQGTPTAEVTTSSAITTAVSSDLVGWLAARVDEGGRGLWTRQSPPQGKGPPVSPGNPNITGVWTSIGLKNYASNDQTAWCMGFVNFALKQCGYRWCPEASSWAIRNNPGKWNATSVPLDQGQPGDIGLWSYGHVNFVYTAKNGRYTFVGGNQGGQDVTDHNPQTSTVSIAWPGGYKPPHDNTLLGLWRPSKS